MRTAQIGYLRASKVIRESCFVEAVLENKQTSALLLMLFEDTEAYIFICTAF